MKITSDIGTAILGNYKVIYPTWKSVYRG